MSVPNIIIHTQTEDEIKATLIEKASRVNLDMPGNGSINDVSYAEMHRLADWIKKNVPTKPPVKLPTERGSVIRVIDTENDESAIWMLTESGWASDVILSKAALEHLINDYPNSDIEVIR